MLLVVVFTLIAIAAWFAKTDVWRENGEMVIGYITVLAVIVHAIAFILGVLDIYHFPEVDWVPSW